MTVLDVTPSFGGGHGVAGNWRTWTMRSFHYTHWGKDYFSHTLLIMDLDVKVERLGMVYPLILPGPNGEFEKVLWASGESISSSIPLVSGVV